MKDSVEKWYKDKAKKLKVIPPHTAWENIENSLQDWPKHWYEANSNAVKPSIAPENWEFIHAELRSQKTAKWNSRIFVIRTSAVMAIFALLPFFITDFLPTSNDIKEIATSESPRVEDNSITAQETVPRTQQKDANPGTYFSSNAQEQRSKLIPIETTTSIAPEAINLNSLEKVPATTKSTEVITLAYLRPKQLQALTTGRTEHLPRLFTGTNALSPEPTKANTFNRSKWQVGPTAFFAKTSILNPLTTRKQNADVTGQNSFSSAFGVSVSRKLSIGNIAMDFLFNERNTQEVAFQAPSSEGRLTTDLEYFSTTLRFEHAFPILKSLTQLQPQFNCGMGIFGAYLMNTDIVGSGKGTHYSDFTYRKLNMGWIVTTGASVNLNTFLTLDVGLRLQMGAINIFEGREKVPRNFFNTKTFAVGAQTSLRYNF